MPYKKIIISFILVVFCLVFIFTPFRQAESYPSSASSPTSIKPPSDDTALPAMLNSFKLYYSFLGDVDSQQGYQLPRHGKNRAAAIEYLSAGFATELATAIVDEYTWLIPELGCLAIKPGDGLPIINTNDLPYLTCNQISNRNVIFSREFTGCYSPHDRYLYLVEMKLYEGRWKVSDLSLEELPAKNYRNQ